MFRDLRMAACMLGLVLAAATTRAQAAEAPVADAESTGARSVQFFAFTPEADDSQPEQIFLNCSVDQWGEGKRALKRLAPGVYSATFEFTANTAVEFKFTRTGKWDAVEKTADGGELPNRRVGVQESLTEQVVVCAIAQWADQKPPAGRRVELLGAPVAEGQRSGAPSITGNIRTLSGFESPQLGNSRTILIYLPPEYDKTEDHYPVLYMQDGQNVFDARTSFAGQEWRADETAEKLIAEHKLTPLIIVAITNTPGRINEYTAWKDPQHGGGDADKYLAFITDTLKPLIDRAYRTQPEREHTVIAGSSLGGLMALYAAYQRPDVFGAAAALSPSLGWADAAPVKFVEAHKPAEPIRLWLDTDVPAEGAAAGDRTPAASAAARRLVKALEAQGMVADKDFHYEDIPAGQHTEDAWAARLDRVLIYLFGPPAPTAPAAKPE